MFLSLHKTGKHLALYITENTFDLQRNPDVKLMSISIPSIEIEEEDLIK